MTHVFPTWVILSAGLTGLLATVPVAAGNYQKAAVRVMQAQDVLQLPATGVLHFTQNDEFVLTRQNLLSPVDAKDLKQNGFEIRLFRVADTDKLPTPWLTNQDGCDVYLSVVFKDLKFPRPQLNISSFRDNSWLTPAGGSFTTGHYLMVIEENVPLDPDSERPDYWEVFRLSHALRDDYFKRGVYLDVVPLYGSDALIKRTDADNSGTTANEEELVKAALATVARTVSSKYRCYQPRTLLIAEGPEPMMILASCATDGVPVGG